MLDILKPNNMDNTYERTIFCTECNSVTEHLIRLHSATDAGVTFFRSCNVCFEKDNKRTGNEIHPWQIERVSVENWNALVSKPIY